MKEHPILFSTPMVRAILAGQKTVTRRLVRLPGDLDPETLHSGCDGTTAQKFGGGVRVPVRCPYGEPGHTLWVRESFAQYEPDDVQGARTYYRADREDGACQVRPGVFLKWTPSIHMPRNRSRLTLAVEDVRVERLHAIDDADALAEGIMSAVGDEAQGRASLAGWPRAAFRVLWDEINGKRAAWHTNPWVWRVQFRRLP